MPSPNDSFGSADTTHHTATGHAHSHGGHRHVHQLTQKDRRALRLALIVTGLFFLIQVVGSYISGSLALASDAGHMFADMSALLIAYLSLVIYGNSEHDRTKRKRFTFGFRRLEVLAALVNGTLLIALCVFLVVESIERMTDPHHVDANTMILTASLGLIANAISAFLLHRGEHLSTQSAYWHTLTDMLSSVSVLIGAGIIKFFGAMWVDPLLSLLIAGFITKNAIRLIKTSGTFLMDSAPDSALRDEVDGIVRDVRGVTDVHDLHVWQINPGLIAVSAHVVVNVDNSGDEILASIYESLGKRYSQAHSTFQIEHSDFHKRFGCADCEQHGAADD